MISHLIKFLWPRPRLGLDARFDSLSLQPIPNSGSPIGQGIHNADRGPVDRGAYYEAAYNVRNDRIMTPSLAREQLMSIATAAWRVGGTAGYPFDYGFGPGAHYDCMTPQYLMRPGIRPLRQAQNSAVGPVQNPFAR